MNFKFRQLKANEIECRVGMVSKNGNGCSLLLYKDARSDMQILDEVVGPNNWQRRHYEANGNLFCEVSIYDESKQAWICKSDAGSPSNQEAEKGHASDSFKRACVNWGIGRELYTAPFIWIKLNKDEITQFNGKYRLNSDMAFTILEIEYQDDAISMLKIIDKKKEVRFQLMPKKSDTLGEDQQRSNELNRLWEKIDKDANMLKEALELNGFTSSKEIPLNKIPLLETTLNALKSKTQVTLQ